VRGRKQQRLIGAEAVAGEPGPERVTRVVVEGAGDRLRGFQDSVAPRARSEAPGTVEGPAASSGSAVGGCTQTNENV